MRKFITGRYPLYATLILTFGIVLMTTSSAFGQLQFNFVDANGAPATDSVDPIAVAGFKAAADRWSNIFDDPITINIEVGFAPIPTATGATILGSTGSTIVDSTFELTGDFPTFSGLKDALKADAASVNDQIAVDNLPIGLPATLAGSPAFDDGSPVNSLVFRTNDRAGSFKIDNGTELGGLNPDGTNNTFFAITSANAKALGLPLDNPDAIDAQITFNSTIAFDFDPSDGITPGQTDFIGVATHEIGHALGVISGVDTVDAFTGDGPSSGADLDGPGVAGIGTLDFFPLFSTFDLFRRSQAALDLDPDSLDFSNDVGVFFSIDGVLGDGNDIPLETGSFNGTGQQASHLLDGLGLGILDPTAGAGELLVITENDILLLDVIGYDLIGGGEFLLGDVNRDDEVDFLDVTVFISLLTTGSFQDEGDFNGDGVVNFLDIGPFITALAG